MKNIGKSILMCGVLLVLGVAVGTLFLVLAFLIPVDQGTAQESYDIMAVEDGYPALPAMKDVTGLNVQSFEPGVLDNPSDAIMLYTALDAGQEGQNALYRSMNMYSGYLGRAYAYYWHGYVSVLRPLLCIFRYDNLRFLNGLLQMLLVFILAQKVWQKKGRVYGLVMITSYFLLMPIALMFALEYTWIFYVAMLSTLFLVCNDEWAAEKQRYVAVFFVTGMLTSYFDLLTYPLFTWGIPVLWWIMMRKPEGKGISRILEVVASGISWVLGYGLFWAMKWCLGTLVLRQNIIQSAINEIFLRSGVEEKLTIADRFNVIYVNWKHYAYGIYALILAAWLVWGLVKGLRKGWNISYNIFAYGLVGISSVVWYFVLANHTGGHHRFTYRIFNISVLAFLAVWTEAFKGESAEYKHVYGKKTGVKLLAVMLIGIASVGGVLVAREEIRATNGYAPYHQVQLSEQDVLSMEFRPTFSQIKEFAVCAQNVKESGMIEVTVRDGDRVSCSGIFSLENWGEAVYHSIPVEWKLEEGKEYTMQIRLLENDGTVDILVTDEGVSPMNECGAPRIGKEVVGGQIVMGITYWHYPTSRKMQLFLFFTWIGISSCLALVLYSIYDIVWKITLKTDRGR